ncbi:hypothetical protein LZG04_11700 [Saccharothrix sp. S26]|uniref:hypothetical protein n=1 Tax=Saccharothrix sp. S26 TaxID=2907215 RepID=UPI001F3F9D25|nr:hypothetical protein [Saccharothrix sp. S26]MCE6995463.1 hypothetical protein [Saccharothrix sp. S26]
MATHERPGNHADRDDETEPDATPPDRATRRVGRRSLVTTSHEVIRKWAERRNARPATLPGGGDRPEVLRLDLPGYGSRNLRHIEWDEWFAAFDARQLRFSYQEQRSDGSPSNFFRLESPGDEGA